MPYLRKYPITLAAAGSAGDSTKLDISGSVLAVYESSFQFQLSLDGEAPIPAERGLKLRYPFRQITLQNLSTVANTVVLLAGDGEFDDSRISIRQQVPTIATGLAHVVVTAMTIGTAQLIEPANPARAKIIMSPVLTNTGNIFLCSLNSSPNTLLAIGPTTPPVIMDYSGPIYVYSTNGTDIVVISRTNYY